MDLDRDEASSFQIPAYFCFGMGPALTPEQSLVHTPQSRTERSALLVVQRFAHQMELSARPECAVGPLQDSLEDPAVVLWQVAGHDHQVGSGGERVAREVPRMGGDPILHSPLGYELPRDVADGREIENDRSEVRVSLDGGDAVGSGAPTQIEDQRSLAHVHVSREQHARTKSDSVGGLVVHPGHFICQALVEPEQLRRRS